MMNEDVKRVIEFYENQEKLVSVSEFLASLTNKQEELLDIIAKFYQDIEAFKHSTKKWWEGTDFDIKESDGFYTVIAHGAVGNLTYCGTFSEDYIKFGNASKDREYMEKRAKEIKLSNLIANFAHVVNEGWEPDWNNPIQEKWEIRYMNRKELFYPIRYTNMYSPTATYFKNIELAQRCIDEVLIPLKKKGEL